MSDETKTARDLRVGTEYPYDGNRPEIDWAHKAARGILYDLSDRRGIKHEIGAVDQEIKIEITDSMADAIREALVPAKGRDEPEPYLLTAHIERCVSAFRSGFSTVDDARMAGIALALAADRDALAGQLERLRSDRPFITGHNDGYNLALEHVYEAFTDTTPTHTDEVEAFSDRLALLRETGK
jgi:hypothetical protein